MGVAPINMSNTNSSPPRRRCEGDVAKNNTGSILTLNHRPPRDSWGHKMKRKEDKIIRVSFVNVNGIGAFAKHIKSEGVRNYMVEKTVDVMGIAETNVHWGKVHNKDTIWDRTKAWAPDRRIGVSYNTQQRITGRHQQGGTATIVTNDISYRYKSSGYDTSGLGRWSWVLVSGKQNCITRFVTVYAPQKGGNGMNTVYEQHLAHLKENPIRAFWKDLANDIATWQKHGEQLILSGDWNEDVAGTNLKTWMGTFGLREAITTMHSSKPPPTFQRGSHAIDGIFVSPNIDVYRSGYLGFGEVPGDHRAIWIDVRQKSILGYKMADIPIARARRLKLEDPRVVKRYQTVLSDYMVAHKVYARLKILRKGIILGQPLTEEQAAEYEKLDSLRDTGMKKAEKQCRKLKMGGYQWSPALQTARDTILFWTLIRRRLKRCKVGARRILRLKKRLHLRINTNLPLETVELQLNKAYKRYKVCRRNDKALRRNYLEELAQAKAEAGQQKAAQVLRNMQTMEVTRRTFRRIRYTTKKRQSGTTKIQVKRRRRLYEITKKKEMEKHILRENERKVHQTEGRCPLLHGQLYKDLGAMGDGPCVEAVLKGTYEPPEGTSHETRAWLRRMAIKNPKQRKRMVTSLKAYQKGWKKIKEQTASGALHMGHFKAGALHPRLCDMHYELSMIPMMTGYSPRRWQNGIDVMLLKSPEVYLLDKLRTIVLFEADFNHENKRLGREAMYMALSEGKIADEQFSRPGSSAQDNALSKRLVFDYFRLRKRPFGMVACDLKACYDRVVHTAASLALQRVGVSLPQIQCMFGTIQKLVHRIRTTYGLSEGSYGGDFSKYRKPPQGMGQGNGAGPTVWSILSSTIFEELHHRGYSSGFCYAISTGLYQLCGFSYVDDCDLLADGENATEVYAKLKKVLNIWEKLMEVNGAVIAPDKCWWYLVEFVWNGGKWKYSDAHNGHTLHVRDKNNRVEELDSLSFKDAKEMVGVFLAPDGNQKAQVTALEEKSKEWATKIRASPLDSDAVWIALNCTILKGLEYPLAATTLSKRQLDKVMSPVLSTALPRSGFARTFPHAVVYGPVGYQGLGITSLYEYQFCRHIQDLVDQSWRQTPTGKLLQANLEAVKIEAGLLGPLFDNPIEVRWFNTTSSWVIETYKFCKKHKIVFTEPVPGLAPQSRNDRSIMEIFSHGGYSDKELTQLNRCRLYYRITTVSDIADGLGNSLSIRWLTRLPPTHPSRYKWPTQGNPTRSDWELWDAALRTTICDRELSLRDKLGDWHNEPVHTEWEFLISDDVLYRRMEVGWMEYQPSSQRSRRGQWFNLEDSRFINELPNTQFQHTAGWISNGRIWTSGTRNVIDHAPRNMPLPKTWVDLIRSHPHASWICSWMSLPECPTACAMHMYQGKAICVSDGSFDDTWDMCTAAWVVDMGPAGEAKGGGVVPSPPGQSSAYRGELGGLIGLVTLVWSIEQMVPPGKPYNLKVACDGKSALVKAFLTSRDQFNSRQKSFDLISNIIAMRDSLRANIEPVHVYGHQDDLGLQLTHLETLNVRMDMLAKEILQESVKQDLDRTYSLPINTLGIVQVDYVDIPITSNLASTLQFHIRKEKIMKWWARKHRFRQGISAEDIDWNVLQRTSKEQSFAMGRFVSKWTSHHIAVGRTMGIRKARDSDECPCCGEENETTIHVLRCQCIESRRQWRKGIKTVSKWMTGANTDPEIHAAIFFALRRYNKEGQYYNTYVDPNLPRGELRECVIAQSDIGWTGFLEGLLSPQWAKLQQKYYRRIGSKRSGTRWAITLSLTLWRLIFSMWDHRNFVLFGKGKVDEISGIAKVKTAIQQEQQIGIGELDRSFVPYINITQSSFSKMKAIDLRRWLSLIRQAREETGYIYNDEFSTSTALRKWVGLSKSPNSQKQTTTPHQKKQHAKLRFIRTGYLD